METVNPVARKGCDAGCRLDSYPDPRTCLLFNYWALRGRLHFDGQFIRVHFSLSNTSLSSLCFFVCLFLYFVDLRLRCQHSVSNAVCQRLPLARFTQQFSYSFINIRFLYVVVVASTRSSRRHHRRLGWQFRETPGNGTLYFPPFPGQYFRPVVHEGIYRCRAANQAGTILSREVHVRAGM